MASKRITLTDDEQRILNYVLRCVADDLEYDGSTDDYRDCGGIICCLERDEYDTFIEAMRKIRP